MKTNEPQAHPWMANSTAEIQQAMLADIGARSIAELFEQIPADHRLERPLDLPPALASETELQPPSRRHAAPQPDLRAECLSFLGAGCWQHHVPAVVDEIVGRTEFLTPVWGSPQSDHGRNQAWFEFNSQLGELLDMEVVRLPVYSWGCAAGHAIRMASRLTGRHQVLLPRHRRSRATVGHRNLLRAARDAAPHRSCAGRRAIARPACIDVADLERKISPRTAAVYFENPSFLGMIEANGAEIAALARQSGAETIVGVDPLSPRHPQAAGAIWR